MHYEFDDALIPIEVCVTLILSISTLSTKLIFYIEII
jgi:hypothetical protein